MRVSFAETLRPDFRGAWGARHGGIPDAARFWRAAAAKVPTEAACGPQNTRRSGGADTPAPSSCRAVKRVNFDTAAASPSGREIFRGKLLEPRWTASGMKPRKRLGGPRRWRAAPSGSVEGRVQRGSFGSRRGRDDRPAAHRREEEQADPDPDQLAEAAHDAERHAVGAAESQRDEGDHVAALLGAEAPRDEERREANAGAERFDHRRRRPRDGNAEEPQDQPCLRDAEEPRAEVEEDRQRQAARLAPVEVGQRGVHPRRGGAAAHPPDPEAIQQARAPADEP